MEQVKEIPINKIVIPSTYDKLAKDGAKDKLDPKELQASIKLNGLLQPICVKEAKGKYVLVFGKNRLNAYKNMGFKTIPSIVKSTTDELDAVIIQLSENLLRNKNTLLDFGRFFNILEKDYSLSREEMSKRTGRSHGFIVSCMNVYNAIPKKDHKKVKTVPASVLTKLATGVKKSYIKPSQAKDIAQTVKDGLVKVKDVNNIIYNMSKNNNLEVAVKQSKGVLHVSVTVDIFKNDLESRFDGSTVKLANYLKKLFYEESGVTDPSYKV
jgi:ParB family transcriptional regulator, chromosome partitioning protein